MSKLPPVPVDWDDLLRKALLGAGRLGNGDASLSFASFETEATSSEHALLRNAAAIAPLQRAGQVPVPTKSALKPLLVAPQESLPTVSRDAEMRLSGLVQEGDMNLLPEWLETAASVRKRVPFALLPQLFETFRSRNYARATDALCATIGARGYWLAAQNSDWAFVIDHAAEGNFADAPKTKIPEEPELNALWNTGTLRERLSLLRSLRRTDAPTAVELVKSTWPTEELKARRDLLRVFEIGLNDGDEPFLAEVVKGDRSEEVRQTARELLLKLPNSAFSQSERERVQRLEVRAQAMFNVRKPLLGDIKVAIDPPETFDATMVADGIAEKAPAGYQGGPRAWWLEQIVAAVDPPFWLTLSPAKITPEQFLKAVQKTDWAVAVTHGLRAGTIRYQNADWAASLSKHDPAIPLVKVLPKERRTALIVNLLDRMSEQLIDSSANILMILGDETLPWDALIGRAALNKMREIVARDVKSVPIYQLQIYFRKFALKVPAELAREASEDWPQNAPSWPDWQKTIEHFLSTLQTRADMIREIQAP